MALGNKKSRVKVRLDNDLAHNSLLDKKSSKLSEKIKLNKCDNILKLKDKKILIKIDTEGYELEVLSGMKNLASNNKLDIITEYTLKAYKKVYPLNRIKFQLGDLFKNYSIYKIETNRLIRLNLIELLNCDEQINLFLIAN